MPLPVYPGGDIITPTENPQLVPRKAPMAQFINMVSVIVLICSQIWAVAIAAIWAVDELFNMGVIGAVILSAIFAPPACWATYKTIIAAIDAELYTGDVNQ